MAPRLVGDPVKVTALDLQGDSWPHRQSRGFSEHASCVPLRSSASESQAVDGM